MGVVGTIIVAAILLAWLVPLIVGIRLLRSGQRASGLVLTIIGGIWAIPSILGMLAVGVYWTSMRSNYEVKDFKSAEYRGATGVVRTPYRGSCTLMAARRGEREQVRYASDSGTFAMPVGTYTLQSFTVSAKAPAGQTWDGTSRLYTRSHGTFEVKRDAPQELRVGPPYTAQISVSERSGKAYLSLTCKDSGGYDAVIQQTGRSTGAPGFEIINKAGATLFSGKFAFG
jgi:hypothetical protein